MPKFAVKKIEAIKGRQEFFHLTIDEVEQGENFKSETNNKYDSEIKTILTYMECVSNLQTLPRTKFKDITPAKGKVTEYEFKSKHVRAYCFQQPGKGKIVTLWGLKTEQKQDIPKFRSLIKQYQNQ